MSFESSLCVYCGSGLGVDSRLLEAARDLGRLLAQRHIRLIYGGARIGLMGTLELGHRGATELIVVDSMHERKYMMFEQSDAFAIMPGGLGTLDETFEMLTWRKLGLHDKPIILVDIAGYWRPLLALIDHVIIQGFAAPTDRDLYKVVTSVAELVQAVEPAPRPKTAAQPERL